jgi:hypothetical protein
MCRRPIIQPNSTSKFRTNCRQFSQYRRIVNGEGFAVSIRADAAYLAISLLRVLGLFAIFIGSWIVAYRIGQILVQTGIVSCSDKKACEMTAGIVIMPLGGTALYLLVLVTWAIVAWRSRVRA